MSAYERYRSRIQKTHGIDIDNFRDSSRGGRADRFPIRNITAYDLDEICNGIKVETEHTSDKMKALEIALDHLSEMPDYYTRLEKMEKRGKIAKAVDDLLKGRKSIAHLVKKRVMSKRGHMMTVYVLPDGKAPEKKEQKQPQQKKKSKTARGKAEDILHLKPEDLHEVKEGKSKRKKGTPKKSIPEKKKTAKDPYQDVGEKIGGARKDLAAMISHYKSTGAPITADDLEILEQDQKIVAALVTRDRQAGTKQQIIDTMKAAGAGPGAVYMVMNTIAAIPAKPSEETPEARRQFIAAIDYITRSIRNVKTVEDWKQWRGMIKDMNDIKVSGDDFERYTELIDKYSKKSAEEDKMRERFERSGGANWRDDFREWRKETGIAEEMDRLYRERRAIESASRQRAYENPYSEYNLIRSLGKRFDKYMFYPVMRLRKSWLLSEDAQKMEDADDWSKIGIKRDARVAKRKTPTWEREAPEKVERSGGREIKGKVASKKLMEMVGLRAVEYGNYMDADSSAEHTKRCAEAFYDLADVLGIDPKMVSFKGRLALAFGARGKGKFKAHYEPYKQVINMTKFNGGGSLAHEWGHFLDNVASVVYGGTTGNSFMSDKSDRPGVPPELKEAFDGVKAAMSEGTVISSRKITRSNINRRRRVYIVGDLTRLFDYANGIEVMPNKERDKIMDAIKAIPTPGKVDAWTEDKIAKEVTRLMKPVKSMSDYNAILNDAGYNTVIRATIAEHGKGIASEYEKKGLKEKYFEHRDSGSYKGIDRAAVEKYIQDQAEKTVERVKKSYNVADVMAKPRGDHSQSDFWNMKYANSAIDTEIGRMLEYTIHVTGHENLSATAPNLDLHKASSNFKRTAEEMGEYWKRPWEMFARAFESYVYDKLAEKGVRNTYLVSGVSKEEAARWGKEAQLIEKDGGQTSPYPIGEERKKINEAFDRLIGAIKSTDLLTKAMDHVMRLYSATKYQGIEI
ncbi:MAG TPA: hypothetical protein PKM65_20250 [Spirochaetota bacterium]|nr:hypothetical protein [Spirochaetota bacterium]